MLEKEIYLELAERYFAVYQEELLKENTKIEVAAFCVYHAYESLACSTISHFKRSIPLKTHSSKLTTFYVIIKSKQKFKSIAKIAFELNYKF